MNDFSIGKTAFSGYGLIARKPLLTLVLLLVGILSGILIAVMAVQVAGPQLAQMQAMAETARAARSAGPPDPAAAQAQAQAMMQSIGPIFQFEGLVLIIGLALSAINAGAVNRAVLRPKTSGFPYIGFMGDELRIAVVTVVLAVIFAIPSFVLFIIDAIVAVGVSGGPAAMRQGGGPPTGIIAAGAVVIGILAFLVAVKFALAAAQTVAEKGIRIFGSWQLTNGRYWKVVATLLLAAISLVPFGLVGFGVLYGVAHATGAEVRTIMQPDYSTMAAVLTPLAITRNLVFGILGAIAVIVLGAPPAKIYEALAGGAVSGASDDDDDEDWDD